MNFENSKVSCALAVPLLYGMDNYAYSLNKILKLFSTRKDIDENKVKSHPLIWKIVLLILSFMNIKG